MKKVMRSLTVALLMAFSLSVAWAQATETKRGITPEDYYSFEFLSDPHISPDGKLVAYVVTLVDQKQNRRVSNVWVAATDNSRAPRQFTFNAQSSTSPRWSPDGQTLAFLSSRAAGSEGNVNNAGVNNPLTANAQGTATETAAAAARAAATPNASGAPQPSPSIEPTAPGTPGITSAQSTASADTPRSQIYVLSLNGGEARRVTNLKNGVSSFQWSPDGTRFVVLSRTGLSDEQKIARSDVRHYRHTSYKFNDTGWFDDKRSHLWIVNAETGAAKQITFGEDWNDTDP